MVEAQTNATVRAVALYEHNTRLAEAFWEWQHKSLTLFTTGIGALLAIDAWMYDRDFGRWLAVPTAAAFMLSWLCAEMAGRNRRILHAAYLRGAELEGLLRMGLDLQQTSIYQWLAFESTSFYRRWLPWILPRCDGRVAGSYSPRTWLAAPPVGLQLPHSLLR